MRTMIAVPCMDMVHTDFFRSCVGLETEGEIQWTLSQSSLVYDGRNLLSQAAVGGGFDRVLWLDSDMVFDRYLFRRLSEHLDQGKDIVCGLYFTRKDPIKPVIYKALYSKMAEDGRSFTPIAETWEDYPRDDIFEVAACGFAAVMMKTEVLKQVIDRFGLPFSPQLGFGEDMSFCLRAKELGIRMWCDSSIKVGHVGTTVFDESVWKSLRGMRED